jgi:two-component system, OmpR family, KDP operon response regulator KdpE
VSPSTATCPEVRADAAQLERAFANLLENAGRYGGTAPIVVHARPAGGPGGDAAGADDYVTKPFGPRELIARLEAGLRRVGPEREETVITAGDLSVDLASRVVALAGSEVHLTPTEFDLLRLLAANRGRLMTHRELLTSVWGLGYANDTQVLRAHIANLRRKIEPAGAQGGPSGHRYIRTDPGVGYRFAG